jgi:transcriptional regulator with XRE-family HTH domain
MVPTQVKLSKMTGIDKNIVNALENNRMFLSSSHALLISDALGCKLDDLFEKHKLKNERN